MSHPSPLHNQTIVIKAACESAGLGSLANLQQENDTLRLLVNAPEEMMSPAENKQRGAIAAAAVSKAAHITLTPDPQHAVGAALIWKIEGTDPTAALQAIGDANVLDVRENAADAVEKQASSFAAKHGSRLSRFFRR